MRPSNAVPAPQPPVLPEAAVFSALLHFLHVPLQGSVSPHAVGNGPHWSKNVAGRSLNFIFSTDLQVDFKMPLEAFYR